MAMTPRRMRPEETESAQDLYAVCHPFWPERPAAWIESLNPLVIVEGGDVVGLTLSSITLPPTPDLAERIGFFLMLGHDVAVHPDLRGRGLGRALFAARMALGAAAGVDVFIGVTSPSNVAMLKIFADFGLTEYAKAPNAFPFDPPEDRDGVCYIGSTAARTEA